MRLHSPVPGISREISKPVTVGGVTFPKYTKLSVNIYALHHNPHVWGNDHMVGCLILVIGAFGGGVTFPFLSLRVVQYFQFVGFH